MPHADVAESIEHALIGYHAVGAREGLARFGELHCHGIPLPILPAFTPSIYRGFHPAGASSNPSKENPGATVQPTSVQAPRLSAVCQARAGTVTCGTSPAGISAPSRNISSFAPSTTSSLSGAPE